ncbi:hypothetical protein C8R46DRAFT_1044579 [Mycena filopes]|nr:hypothetical protein C8R46DRAFT_1044579 [Mycena filopes]
MARPSEKTRSIDSDRGCQPIVYEDRIQLTAGNAQQVRGSAQGYKPHLVLRRECEPGVRIEAPERMHAQTTMRKNSDPSVRRDVSAHGPTDGSRPVVTDRQTHTLERLMENESRPPSSNSGKRKREDDSTAEGEGAMSKRRDVVQQARNEIDVEASGCERLGMLCICMRRALRQAGQSSLILMQGGVRVSSACRWTGCGELTTVPQDYGTRVHGMRAELVQRRG